ncbi:uncharacterized protein MONBRDRAFT_39004 [Monosiga brevicollis MX1]|uniref:Uncharacterized protein n=1 Tax=Monosiga brevicollis TaxID=81824 RepID=A9VBK9_MONBE|nr:uncharacterized protein MONBRDRAFT_39004 [Monosiga brevicollis MX1]EDQ85082.1 predicted protein [Monosiga brevicollis MX1]|eukprot:XP_001750086.1 hypothetical protein [Monosiga brevicollis MX1]
MASPKMAAGRVRREIADIKKDKQSSGVKIELVDDADLFKLRGQINGPPDTPFEGACGPHRAVRPPSRCAASLAAHLLPDAAAQLGNPIGSIYDLDIEVPSSYPFSPPKVKFLTKIWHPNISSVTGAICLDILTEKAWAAAMTLRTVLLSIQAMLTAAEPDDPQDAVVARQYKDARDSYNRTARYWSRVYANAPHTDADVAAEEELVQKLVDMGTSRDKAIVALSSSDWTLERAVERAFG